MKTFILSIFCNLFIIVLFGNPVYCQSTDLTTEGTDFWFTFMPNLHAENSERDYIDADSVHIYISSKLPNKGTIYYSEGTNTITNKSITWQLSGGNSIYHVTLPYTTALRGEHNTFRSRNTYDNRKVSQKSFHIVAENSCSAYALDYAQKSAEAFIVLPTQVLGTQYVINTYNSHKLRSESTTTPSQFAIVAPNDNTSIKIIPSDNAFAGNNNAPINIVLNKGEVYLMQADINVNISDVTGTQIIADKSIAVFAGHQRASIPNTFNINPSRDCLIEQQLPTHTWGKKVIITPFAKPKVLSGNPATDTLTGIYRVVACMDSTNIYENELLVATINKGQFYEGTLKSALISSENPIMVTTFMPTAIRGDRSSETASGDPSMVAIPPIEQYKSDINIMNAQIVALIDVGWHYEESRLDEQYVTIIVPDVAKNTVTIDGILQNATDFISVGNTKYSFANIAVKEGQHTITAKMPIAVLVYGYGTHISYAYLGGMTFMDLQNTSQLKIAECYNNATWTYTKQYDSAIAGYKIISTYNCNLVEQRYDNWSIVLEIEKINQHDIAYFSVELTDMYGQVSLYESDTIATYSLDSHFPVEFDFAKQQIGTMAKANFSIINDGTLPVSLDEKNFKLSNNTNFTLGKTSIFKEILPKDSAMIEVFYAPTTTLGSTLSKPKIDTDTLHFTWNCGIPQAFVLTGEPVSYSTNSAGICDIPIRLDAGQVLTSRALPSITPMPVSEGTLKYFFALTENENATISIYDANGNLVKEVASWKLTAGEYEMLVDVNGLTQGMYFIELKTSAEPVYSKFIINDSKH